MKAQTEPAGNDHGARVGSAWRIDAHQHYWRVSRGDYPWMPADGPLRRDYLPADMTAANATAGVRGTILVQAAPTVAETRFLFDLALSQAIDVADVCTPILGVVGWLDLEADVDSWPSDVLEAQPLVGVRPMIQDINDDAWITRPAVTAGLQRLASQGLTFELLCRPRHLAHAIDVLERVPALNVVIDHLGKPDYSLVDADWAVHMRLLAQRPRTFCKLAGLVNEVGRHWAEADFRAHIEVVLDAFGPSAIMAGTDWPVHLPYASHRDVVILLDRLLAHLSNENRQRIWEASAMDAYGLDRLARDQADL